METLYKGLLMHAVPFYIRKLEEDDLSAAMSLQQEVAEALEDQDVLAALSEEELLFIMRGGGMIIGVFVGDQLIALRATLVPEIDDEHLGYDIGLNTAQLATVLYQEVSCVSIDYRGHGLQKLMAKVLMEQVQESDYTYVCATVAPFNIPSLKDKFTQQLEVKALKKKYGGKLRYVFAKKINELNKKITYESEQLIPMSNIALQQELLADGWNGTGMTERADEWLVRYEK